MIIRLTVAVLLAGGAMLAQQPNGAAINPPWTSGDVINVDELSKIVQAKANAPLLLQVGFALQYKSKHIPGAIYAGPGREDAGLAELKKAVANVPEGSPDCPVLRMLSVGSLPQHEAGVHSAARTGVREGPGG